MGREQKKYENNLHKRFVKWVLLPPFIAILILSVAGLYRLNGLLRSQALNDLHIAATTTAEVLHRELELRQTILKSTGDELLLIKNQYNDARAELDRDYQSCREHLATHFDYSNSPDGACDQFASALANHGVSYAVLEDRYVELAKQQIAEQTQRTSERLSTFKQIFPETLALVAANEEGQVVSSALSGVLEGSTKPFETHTKTALNQAIYGERLNLKGFNLGVFATPISDGSVLAAYDLYNENFLKRIWDSAPVDRSQALAVVLDGQNNVAYPNTTSSDEIRDNANSLRTAFSTSLVLDEVDHTAVAAEAGSSGWLVVIASPTAAVLAQSRDAQLVGVIFIGLFIIGFVWVGSFFIQRTLANIVRLMSGAMIFATGRFDYNIELADADSEFVRLGETMNQMAQRIAEAEAAIDEKNKEFISVATHEIRAPLTAIIGHLSLVQEMYGSKLDKKANTLINEAYYGSARLRDLVNDMLNVARLESGKSQISLSHMQITPIIEGTLSTMSVVAAPNNIVLHYDPKNASDVIADEALLRIIINNFVSNAIKYNKPNGTVEISHTKDDGQLVTAVKDSGLGIPDDQKAQMFEKFFRVEHQDRKSVTGTGLGMYVVKQYIEQMNGRIWFDSVHGQGTTFYFSLPIAKSRRRRKLGSKIRKLSKQSSKRAAKKTAKKYRKASRKKKQRS